MSADTMSGHERDKMILQKTGGPAFPAYGQGKGMSLRDWFAGQALAGRYPMDDEFSSCLREGASYDKHAARVAYAIADAMIAERERQDG